MIRRVALGVTGHRLNQLPEADIPRLKRTLARVMDKAQAAAVAAARRDSVRMTVTWLTPRQAASRMAAPRFCGMSG